ncbi:hypothetical protein G7Y79_00008g024510 [Physcia stellaris]|nr:hypothetical protein G7Y79_00008g024510 [Physcia stellaris]
MRLTMELRSMGGSDMLMAPQQGNDLRIGIKLNARLHRAKDQMDMKTDVVSMQQHLKRSAYNDQILAVKAELTEIRMAQGWTMDDLRKSFLDQRWDTILYS